MKHDINTLLNNKKYISNVIQSSEYGFSLDFTLLCGKAISLIMIFSKHFPYKLPVVFFNEKNASLPNLPHILDKGYICYNESEGQSWSLDPSLALDYVFMNIENVFDVSRKEHEFHREFNHYFSNIEGVEVGTACVNSTDEIKQINYYYHIDKKQNKKIYFYDLHCKTINNLLGANIQSNLQGVYIPIADKTLNYPLPARGDFWTADEIKQIVLNHIAPENLKKLKKTAKNKQEQLYLLDILLLTNQRVLIGLIYRKKKNAQCKKTIPIIEEESFNEFEITPLYIKRIDKDYLLQRTMTRLNEKKVLIIGCGSLGSDIGFLIARTGIENITLVDNDKLRLENSYRHFLGLNDAKYNINKAILMQIELENRYPHSNIKAYKDSILDLIGKDIIFDEFDLIIIALGNPPLERLLNSLLLESKTPAIFSCIEAFGIGGHAVLINNGGKGCFECLYDDFENKYSYAAKQDKSFVRNANGCSGAFTPYGSLDTMNAAVITSKLAVYQLQNKIVGNPLVSWTGDCTDFVENGYITSELYSIDSGHSEGKIDSPVSIRYDYVNDNCICSKQE